VPEGAAVLTRELLLREMSVSERNEEQIYRDLTLRLFRELQGPLKGLYDRMAEVTGHLTALTPQALQDYPRIIKVLRYCLAPVISQMRLGQMIEIGSTEGFEEKGNRPTDAQADRLAQWFQAYLDQERFPWVANPGLAAQERGIAEHYAKLCTVSLMSNQNTATKYRNQRKELQERAIAGVLGTMGLTPQARLGPAPPARKRRKKGDPPLPPPAPRLGGINAIDDVQPRCFVTEQKVLAGSEKNQKSDVTTRPTEAEVLYCIEAKAVGIRIDSTKRLKELNDKFTDWAKAKVRIVTVGVCAGFFNSLELIATIRGRGVPIFFEHDLTRLVAFLQTGVYYDAPWAPAALFPDVPVEEVQATLQKIQAAPPAREEAEMPAADAGEPEVP
jgi:hypothetical protein